MEILRNEIQSAREKYVESYNELKSLKKGIERNSKKYRWVKTKEKLKLFKHKVLASANLNKKLKKQTGTQINFNYKPYSIISKSSGNTARKRILHAIPTFSTGGSQQLVVDLIENISGEYEHFVVIGRERGPIGYIGVPIKKLDVNASNLAEYVKDYLQTFQPDIVHVHFWATLENTIDWYWYHIVFQQAFNLNLPIIQNCNNPTFPYFDKRIKHNVFVSNYAKVVFGLDAPQNTVIYPGSNFNKFKLEGADYIPGETIGMVYRLEKDKLNEQSIEPFIRTVKKRPGTKALIVGGGTLYDFYRKRVEDEGVTSDFEFTGYVPYDELPSFYKKISIFIAPVHQESFGQVTPFAMNMGIPVAGYNVGALSEILDNDSLLAEKGDSDLLSDIIVSLLNDKDRMINISRFNMNRAKSLFSLETMISSYELIYKSI